MIGISDPLSIDTRSSTAIGSAPAHHNIAHDKVNMPWHHAFCGIGGARRLTGGHLQ
jgi:hypothetical protein